ncbi:ABC transporter substrate-binding protein [Tolypothrix sp. LEGE 11397]|nr:putative WD40-repeat protein [Tolypothrix sp. PCC 7601]MBE9087590.1 ABC transporter substrate-binding protein [Tolypothrix sp. LEGE 11397]UYD27099.1 ABC transporter substrate-binding protein [Tolypothrix sp. PCC 7712]UYD37042.1 ABC transporter substrate-binding protein [Tolypothrix sp. PCC 7601]BAY93228.1 TPR repeat-containing protein [Microchaete diplosiphon NIES-3275]
MVISLEKLGTKGVTQEQWYDTLIKNIADNFDLQTEQVSTLFQDNRRLTPLNLLSDFFEKKLLAKFDKNIVTFIDEIDTVLSLDFPTDDFFGFIRYCYNQRANNPNYERITFALLGVATPSQLIKDTRRTPFNIGEAIQLNGFSFQEARPLAKGLKSKVNDLKIAEEILLEVLKLTSGQPFLTQKICKIIVDDENVIPSDKQLISKWIKELVKSRIIDNWEFQDEPQHLRTIRDRIINSKEPMVKLLKFYLEILRYHDLPSNNSPEQSELVLSGLLEEKAGKLKVYNLIYESVFDSNWVAEMLADIKPYEEELLGWLSSNRKDKSWLLLGQKLQIAIEWCKDKNLAIEDYQFINASQELEIANIKTSQELEIANIKANQELQIAELENKIIKSNRSQRLFAGVTASLMIFTGVITFQLKEKIQSVFIPYIEYPELFSQGEKSFFLGNGNYYQNQGVNAFNRGNYTEAINQFAKAKEIDKNDPEGLIYYNNALAHKKGNYLTLAVAVPINARRDMAKEILRGVAQAQDEFNKNAGRGANDKLLNIVIADDKNDPSQGEKVAQQFIKDAKVLGVIGHNGSSVSKTAIAKYKNANLGMLSPTSTSTELSMKEDKVFFRTVPSDAKAGEKLAEYAIKNAIKRVVIFYKADDIYSKSLKQAFNTAFEAKGGKVVRTGNLADQNLNASYEVYRSVVEDEADAVVFFPNIELISTVINMARARQQPKIQKILGKNIPLLGGDALYGADTLTQGQKALEGLVLPIPWFPQESNDSKKFAKQACKQWGGGISWRTAASYDATQAFIQAISELKNPTRQTVVEKLKSIKLPSKETSGDALAFQDGERDNKPVLVQVVPGTGDDCVGAQGGGYHFEKVDENSSSSSSVVPLTIPDEGVKNKIAN